MLSMCKAHSQILGQRQRQLWAQCPLQTSFPRPRITLSGNPKSVVTLTVLGPKTYPVSYVRSEDSGTQSLDVVVMDDADYMSSDQ